MFAQIARVVARHEMGLVADALGVVALGVLLVALLHLPGLT